MNVDALEQLAAMRERGLITEEEFQAKRSDILDRLRDPPPGSSALADLVRVESVGAPLPDPPAKAKSGNTAGGLVVLLVILGAIAVAMGWKPLGSSSAPTVPSGGAGGGNTPTWQPPSGFTAYSSSIAYKWIGGGSDCLGVRCWSIDVVTRDGCPTSLYVEASIENSSGTQVDYSNDVATALRADQRARLQFETFETSGSKISLTQFTCY